jgi:hypothetical protein
VNPFTCAIGPPFIERRRDFCIPRLPSNLENIPSVNMYMNVFYISWFAGLISYIYKLATSSHFKPGLLRWRLWLGLPLTTESLLVKIITYKILETRLLKIPEIRRFLISWIFTRFQLPWNRQQTREPKANSAIIFAQHLKVSELYEIYQDVFMNVPLSWNRISHPEAHSWIHSRIRQLRRFESARFLPNPPTHISVSFPVVQACIGRLRDSLHRLTRF